MKEFTKETLAKFDGQNGNPAYIAVSGVVYDVSGHYSEKSHYTPGQDITEAFAHAPHGSEVLEHLPKVGSYRE